MIDDVRADENAPVVAGGPPHRSASPITNADATLSQARYAMTRDAPPVSTPRHLRPGPGTPPAPALAPYRRHMRGRPARSSATNAARVAGSASRTACSTYASTSAATRCASPMQVRIAALCRPRISAVGVVTTGRSQATASSVELQPDQPMLSRNTSAARSNRRKRCVRHRRDQHAMTLPVQAGGSEGALQPGTEHRGAVTAGCVQEQELRRRHARGDARPYGIVARQVLAQRLAAQIHGRVVAQSQARRGPPSRRRRAAACSGCRGPAAVPGARCSGRRRPAAPSPRSTGSSPWSAGRRYPGAPRSCTAPAPAAAPPAAPPSVPCRCRDKSARAVRPPECARATRRHRPGRARTRRSARRCGR